jgi:hypothetical protein
MGSLKWNSIAAFTSLVLVYSCAAEDRASRARATEAGTAVAALVSKAGSPTLARTVSRGSPVDPCAGNERNVRAFEYHVPFGPVTGALRKWSHSNTVAAMTVVCLDDDAKVTSTHSVKF